MAYSVRMKNQLAPIFFCFLVLVACAPLTAYALIDNKCEWAEGCLISQDLDPDWYKDTVIYQIYIRSFKDSNGDGIGDLQGIISKLDYLQDLGIETIWLSPIHPSPNHDWGYDVADYYGIHEDYGTMMDFENLIQAAHQRGIKVLMDLVVNHTSDEHPWFQQSRSSLDHPKRDWYVWKKGEKDKLPNNWYSRFGFNIPAWTWDEATSSHFLHSFTDKQPDLNWQNPEVRKAVLDIMNFWLQKGVNGFRLDVVNYYAKDPELKDNPQKYNGWDMIKSIPSDGFEGIAKYFIYPYYLQDHVYDKDNVDGLLDILRSMREMVDSYKAILLGEVDSDDMDSELSARLYGKDGNGLHLAYNKALTELPWRREAFESTIQDWQNKLDGNWPAFAFSNHDVIRSMTRYGEDDDKARKLAFILLSLPGTPIIYYGEEIGMSEHQMNWGDRLDVAKELFSVAGGWINLFKGRDGCRTPMQWDSAHPQADFSHNASTWLPMHPNHWNVCVEKQFHDPHSLLNYYRKLIRERKSKRLGLQDALWAMK